jgi:hypothetical protein
LKVVLSMHRLDARLWDSKDLDRRSSGIYLMETAAEVRHQ